MPKRCSRSSTASRPRPHDDHSLCEPIFVGGTASITPQRPNPFSKTAASSKGGEEARCCKNHLRRQPRGRIDLGELRYGPLSQIEIDLRSCAWSRADLQTAPIEPDGRSVAATACPRADAPDIRH